MYRRPTSPDEFASPPGWLDVAERSNNAAEFTAPHDATTSDAPRGASRRFARLQPPQRLFRRRRSTADAPACSSTTSRSGAPSLHQHSTTAHRPSSAPCREKSCTWRRVGSLPVRPGESARAAAERDGGPAHGGRRRSPPSAMSAGSAQTERVHGQAPWDRRPD